MFEKLGADPKTHKRWNELATKEVGNISRVMLEMFSKIS